MKRLGVKQPTSPLGLATNKFFGLTKGLEKILKSLLFFKIFKEKYHTLGSAVWN